MKSIRASVLGGFASLIIANTASAIEPHPPTQLITAEEAMVILARQRIDLIGLYSDESVSGDVSDLSLYYANHDGPPLWIDRNGLNEKAKLVAAEIKNAGQWGLNARQFDLPELTSTPSTSALAKAEVAMSLAILKYARYARGGRMDPKALSLAIDRTPPLEDPNVILNTLQNSANPVAYLHSLHPQHEQFGKLRLAYLEALQNESKADGSKSKLSQRLLYNMEMWRWMPRELGTKYIWSNVPEFSVRVVKNGKVVHSERIVIGKTTNKTPIFSDEMETIVFHPFWGVPNSIKIKEVLPSLMRGGGIMEKQNLRISYAGREIDPYSVDWSRHDIRNYHVFQPPGRSNALGIVKFMFPNKHAVYMHDTPSKHLFKRDVRAFSHGCMRVRDPLKLAEVVLSHDKGWSRAKIDSLVSDGPENNQITLSQKIPVHVTYFTAQVNEAGKVVTVEDIYDHEKLIQMGLDGQTHLIKKEKVNLSAKRKEVVSNFTSGYSGYNQKKRNPDWMQRVFEN
ncbi:MAG: L,D-transpeptidase family protein [Pseudomonadota bacterium]